MLDGWHDVTLGRTIRAKFVGDDALWREALLFQQSDQQSPSGLGVASVLDDLVENVSVLINADRWRDGSAPCAQGANGPQWLVGLLARRLAKVVAVALANKMARIVFALLTNGGEYRRPEWATGMAPAA